MQVLPQGNTDIGWEEMSAMYKLFAPDIDKINAPHENAHWNWDDIASKAAYDYSASIFGYDGRFTLVEWFGMIMAYDR